MSEASKPPRSARGGPAPPAFELVEPTPGHFALRGELSFRTATAVNSALSRRLQPAGNGIAAALELSLDGVTRSDSAGLAVLLEAMSVAKARGQTLRLSAVPAAIIDIARISEVDDLLLRAPAR